MKTPLRTPSEAPRRRASGTARPLRSIGVDIFFFRSLMGKAALPLFLYWFGDKEQFDNEDCAFVFVVTTPLLLYVGCVLASPMPTCWKWDLPDGGKYIKFSPDSNTFYPKCVCSHGFCKISIQKGRDTKTHVECCRQARIFSRNSLP